MKKVLKTLLMLVVVLITYTVNANDTLKHSTIKWHIKKGDKIKVTDATGMVVYRGYTKQNGSLTHLYDFSQLKNGIYEVEIEKDFSIQTKSIEVKNHSVTFSEETNEKFFKPVFRILDNKVIISKLALSHDEMKIYLYYENDIIYTEVVTGNSILNRVYKLDQTYRGQYTVVVRTNNRVYVERYRL
ncbi:MAG: hypothetical protein HKN40_10255 [Winogradskyella sp.]|uniref:hypothetical protein n=1 Tax=Winogradskyella sp. TaxID=1883156 RepID=UPI0018459335|nr:hypothetical protein [Winogradskyella sp.]